MAKKYEMCGDGVQDLCRSVMEKYHGDLLGARVDVVCLFASDEDKDGYPKPAVKLHGLTCYATCKIVPEINRAAGMADAMILIDKHLWEKRLERKQRKPLLDHELSHLLLKTDDEGTMVDECGRPKLEMRQHDWDITGFADVMERHGANSVELLEARNFYGTSNGQLFFDYTQKSPNLKLVPKSADAVAAQDADLVEQAIEVIRAQKRASTSTLQRRLRIGYNRASRVMDLLEAQGVIGPATETGPRDILIELEAKVA